MLKMSRRLCCLSAESTRARFYSANKICYAVFFVADYGDDPMDVPGPYRIEGPLFRFAKGLELPELLV
jgi:hypothetical protein